jgi:hypothetical protein
MTTEQTILSHLHSKGVLHEDEISTDIDRFLEADIDHQLTENEIVATLRDFFSRLMHDESQSQVAWRQLAQAFESRLGNGF